VSGSEGIVLAEVLVEARSAEIFADMLHRVGKSFGDAAGCSISVQELGAVGDWPQREKRLNARHGSGARGIVGNKRKIAEAEILTEAFVIYKKEGFVFLKRAAERAAKFIALKFGNIAMVKEIACIESAIAQKFVDIAVERVRTGTGNDVDLCAGAF